MRNRAILRLLAALSVLVLFAAACGEDDPDTSAGEMSDDAMSDDEMSDDEMSDDEMSDDEMSDDEMSDDEMSHEGDHSVDGETTDTSPTDTSPPSHDHASMVEVGAEGAPTIDIEVFDDPAGGVNIHVLTENFTANPQAASTPHVEGEGHYHLSIDGEKVLRFYNDWIHYAGVVAGDVDISVGLASNDHQSYAVDGEEIRADVAFTVTDHSHDAHAHGDPVAVEYVGPAPTLDVEVVDDPKAGWNVFVTLDGLTLSPEHASGDHVDGEGHLHIYANGQKLGRLYGSATHLKVLPEGDVEISVVAYANDHNPYVIDGQPISDATTITVAS